jgi:hypothetical protein
MLQLAHRRHCCCRRQRRLREITDIIQKVQHTAIHCAGSFSMM